MRIFFAIVFPPLAVLLCGRPFSALANVFLTICGWIPGMLHAFYIVSQADNDRRMKQMATIVGTASRPR